MSFLKIITKRDGSSVKFDESRIKNVLKKALTSSREDVVDKAEDLSIGIMGKIICTHKESFHVEELQDMIEEHLMSEGYCKTAREYIKYRQIRTLNRKSDGVKDLFRENKKYFVSPLNEFVYLRTYSRWLEDKGRRESWSETVNRYVDFMEETLMDKLSKEEYLEIRESILNQRTMPSMRLMQFSGDPVKSSNVCAYNCSYITPTKIKDFGEILYILMCGVGVGFSVEKCSVEKIGIISKKNPSYPKEKFLIGDSKEGWADALTFAMTRWYEGKDVFLDYTNVRPAGAYLKTMGGRSSGPTPLRELMNFTKNIILKRQGGRLESLDVHDIICKIGDIVVCGGVRRSALISLSDLDDDKIRDCKTDNFYIENSQRFLSNNSSIYNKKPSDVILMKEWLALISSKSGERGIFNRGSLKDSLPQRRVDILKEDNYISEGDIKDIGTNPCGEIILRSKQFCNLSEVVCRKDDTRNSLMEKIRIATILGTYQATLTDFPYISPEWKENCERERLLGVSLTGVWDCIEVRNENTLRALKDYSISINKIYSKRFGIEESTCVTCIKPSGNVSQTVDCSSGIHPRFSPYYIRRVRISSSNPLFRMMKDQGVPHFPETGQTIDNATTSVLEFVIKSPDDAVCAKDISALEQLEFWKMMKINYTEHNPSVTIYSGEDEWIDILGWVKKNWNFVGGLSFLPRSDHIYKLAPYEEITKDEYEKMKHLTTSIDFSCLCSYETSDETETKSEFACIGGKCET